MEKILGIYLKLNSTPNASGCYAVKYFTIYCITEKSYFFLNDETKENIFETYH